MKRVRISMAVYEVFFNYPFSKDKISSRYIVEVNSQNEAMEEFLKDRTNKGAVPIAAKKVTNKSSTEQSRIWKDALAKRCNMCGEKLTPQLRDELKFG
jgi:hypothetical protein